MRVLFTVFAAKPHFYNLVPLAWALRAAGHDVVVASQPDLTEIITATGLTAVPVGDELQLVRAFQGGPDDSGASPWQRLTGLNELDPQRLTWPYVLGVFTIGCAMEYEYLAGQRLLDDLVEFAREWRPDLVIWDALTFAGAIAAHASGAAHARVLFGQDHVARMFAVYRQHLAAQPPEHRDDPVSDWLAGRLDRYDHRYSPALDHELMTGQVTIDPTPPWMQLPLDLSSLPVRYIPFNGPTSVPGWVHQAPGRPRVCLSLGVSGRELFGAGVVSGPDDIVTVADVVAILAEFDVEVVATLTEAQLGAAGTAPDNVRVVEFVPLNELLPSCALIIHHGGFGTTGNAVAHAVPSIIIPAPWWDAASLAELLEQRGAGFLADDTVLTRDGLRDRIARLLADPSHRAAAAAIQAELSTAPSPHDLVPQLVALVASHRRQPRPEVAPCAS
ncbi:activator-dependent family glycosyltransferase [Natronosporangium hydrolyticum]|uniref:Activator-dependent family glycosyltransferase n=1 Tax=Natronosporangium hydrolyticum TaxID=2811111 RepID=A0A895YJ10_9ACTN|nr:activator-dependent family glycosyltransferase [Natronosporangium hydrolyticum]QSB16022.1 activator-dependent family glycosyltransferase [Natronosporangium hydrolyticum]